MPNNAASYNTSLLAYSVVKYHAVRPRNMNISVILVSVLRRESGAIFVNYPTLPLA